ncbi:Aspartate/glutamate leucyltransferase [Neolewinella maritima]|uniref:Aspartate/glutamate leucyltransferase n=1 Tax=Neolewinella maritima TaxID=1383882 RepID=A0ABM9B032_9BACT|nr:arginine-tRNA-protein transferase [Neolewinella maritima]CAH1000130.1 Aspartate/glutamate leucyltransferase [Neolewinella maritima]
MFFNYAEKNTPFTLSPESLDWHLAKGWYRMGSTIFTTHFLFFKNRPYSAIWIRVDLRDFAFSKSQRKLLRKNAQLFDVTIAPRQIEEEHEALYTRYAADFDGRLSPTIADSLEDYDGEVVFNTYGINVRDRVSQKLVACSYVDLGNDSAASILGIYDPLLKSFSLGYYTMLLEIQYCLNQGFSYYYPGYVVPDYQRFDYKLRLGKSEYYDVRSDSWHSYDSLDPGRDGPVEAQVHALTTFVDQLADRGYSSTLKIYPLFEAGLYDIWNDDYFPYPYLVLLSDLSQKDIHVVAFDPKERNYFVLECRHMAQTQLLFNAEYLRTFQAGGFVTDLLAVRQLIVKSPQVEYIVEVCSALRSVRRH